MKLSKLELRWLLLILLAGIAFRLLSTVYLKHQPASDELAYLSMAENFLQGNGIRDGLGNWAFYNAGYPMFILLPFAYLFGDLILGARVANIFLGCLSILGCYYLAREIGLGLFGRLVSSGVYSFYLPTGVYAVYIAKETLLGLLMLLVAYLTIRTYKHISSLNVILLGVLFAGIAMVGNAGLSLLLPLFLVLFFAPGSLTRRFFSGLAVVSIAAVLVSPWLVRNLEVVGAPVLNTNGGFNLYLGNNSAATGYFMSIVDTPLGNDWQQLRRSAGEFESGNILKKMAVDWIVENPTSFLKLAIKKAFLFWWPPTHQGQGDGGGGIERVVRLLWLGQFLFIVAFSLVALFSYAPRKLEVLFLFFIVISYTAVHMVFYVIYRYREPIMPVVIVLCAAGIEASIAWYRSKFINVL